MKTEKRDGVYELKTGPDERSLKLYAVAAAEDVTYAAKEAIDFSSDAATTTLDLTLTGEGNEVTMQAGKGTLNLHAVSVGADVVVGSGVDVNLGVCKHSSVTLSSALDASDILYLEDGSEIGDYSFEDKDIYVTMDKVKHAVVTKAMDEAGKTGRFTYTNGTYYRTLSYGGGDIVDYEDDVDYFARAKTLAVGTQQDEIIHLGGQYKNVGYDTNIATVAGFYGGALAGQADKDNIFHITTLEGHKSEIYGGGASSDTVDLTDAQEGSQNVIWYGLQDGNDSVKGFDADTDRVYFHDMTADTKSLSDILKVTDSGAAITLDGKLSLAGDFSGKVLTFTDAAGQTVKAAIAGDQELTYSSDTKIYKTMEYGTTLKVAESDEVYIETDANTDELGYYDSKITAIDASQSTGKIALSGSNIAGFTLTGGSGSNQLYGGGDKGQVMNGTQNVVDIFWFGFGDGQDTANKVEASDGLNLWNVTSIDDVQVTVGSDYFTVAVGTDRLKCNTQAGTTGTQVLESFTFGVVDHTQYNYDTTTKSFKLKALS